MISFKGGKVLDASEVKRKFTTGIRTKLTSKSFDVDGWSDALGLDRLPTFIGQVENTTVTAGRTAVLTCTVRDLATYKVRTKWLFNFIHFRKQVLFFRSLIELVYSL